MDFESYKSELIIAHALQMQQEAREDMVLLRQRVEDMAKRANVNIDPHTTALVVADQAIAAKTEAIQQIAKTRPHV